VAVRLLHVSDLHIGTEEDAELVPALDALVRHVDPGVIVASGDLTHRGRAAQHDRAATLLRSFERPLVAIPGNHDIPYTFPARFTTTFREFERIWGTTEPVFQADGVLIVGLNSVRPWRQQSGGVSGAQLSAAAAHLRDAPPDALRVVVLHHHLLGAPWRTRKKPVAKRSEVLAALVDAGAELVLAGHIHQGAVSERREFEVAHGHETGVVVSIAPGLGQPRPNRRGEARGLHVYDVTDTDIRVTTYIWRSGEWSVTATRRFGRGPSPLAAAPVV
jgi:3',5'-cyclic AMP phosphodiesterase CpdA